MALGVSVPLPDEALLIIAALSVGKGKWNCGNWKWEAEIKRERFKVE